MKIRITPQLKAALQVLTQELEQFNREYFEGELKFEKKCHAKEAWRKRARLVKTVATGQDLRPKDR